MSLRPKNHISIYSASEFANFGWKEMHLIDKCLQVYNIDVRKKHYIIHFSIIADIALS